jgi:hypothetical protein
MPIVLLEEKQVKVHHAIRVAGEERKLVSIKSKSKLLRDAHYCLVRGRLWTMDGDGNPQARSCFHVK